MPRYWGNCHTRLFCLHSAPCPPHIICGPESSVWLTILSECIIVRHSPGQDVCDCICWGDNSSGGSCFLHTNPLGDAALPHPTMKVVFSWHSLLGRYILWWQLHTEALRDKVLGQKKKKNIGRASLYAWRLNARGIWSRIWLKIECSLLNKTLLIEMGFVLALTEIEFEGRLSEIMKMNGGFTLHSRRGCVLAIWARVRDPRISNFNIRCKVATPHRDWVLKLACYWPKSVN